jgi:hypothetical protein
MISNNIDLSSILLADGTGFLADLGLSHITTPTMSKFSHAPPHKSTIAQQFFPTILTYITVIMHSVLLPPMHSFEGLEHPLESWHSFIL